MKTNSGKESRNQRQKAEREAVTSLAEHRNSVHSQLAEEKCGVRGAPPCAFSPFPQPRSLNVEAWHLPSWQDRKGFFFGVTDQTYFIKLKCGVGREDAEWGTGERKVHPSHPVHSLLLLLF